MKRALLFCTLAASFIGFAGSAHADEFTISFTAPYPYAINSGSITVDTTAQGSGVFKVDGVESGSSVDTALGTYAVTGINTVSGANNLLLFPAAPGFFTSYGTSFSLLNGAILNLHSWDGETWATETLKNNNVYIQTVNVSVIPVQSTSPVPEPSSFVLVGTSALGILGTLRKRFLA